MAHQSKPSILQNASLILALLAVFGADAYAQNPPTTMELEQPDLVKELDKLGTADSPVDTCYAQGVTDAYIPVSGGTLKVVVPSTKVAYLEFPENITLVEGLFAKDGFTIDQTKHSLTIAPKTSLKDGHSANVVIRGNVGDEPKLRTSLEMTFSSTNSRPASIINVVPLPNDDFELHKMEKMARNAANKRKRDIFVMRRFRRSLAKFLLGMKVVRPSGPRVAALGVSASQHYAPDGEVRAVLTRLLQTNDGRYMEIVVDNRTDSVFPIESAWLSEGLEEGVPIDVEFDDQASHKRPKSPAGAADKPNSPMRLGKGCREISPDRRRLVVCRALA